MMFARKFKEFVRKFRENDFAKNIVTLLTGTTAAQIVPFVLSPVLTRLYSPDDFGVLALFFSVCSVLSVVAAGRYELSIVIPEKDVDAVNIVALSIFVSIVFAMVLQVVFAVFNSEIAALLGNQSAAFWLYFVPLVVFMMSLYNILRYFSIRIKDFKSVAVTRAVKSSAGSFFKLVFGFLGFTSGGLVAGEIVSQFFGNTSLVRNVYRRKELFVGISRAKMACEAKKYSDFPKFSLPGALSNSLSLNLNSFFLTSLFSLAVLGQYALVNKAVSIPLNLLGSSVSDAYFQRAAQERNETGSAKNAFVQSAKYLSLIAVPVFLVLFFLGGELFAFVFGESWRIAGNYAEILSFLVAVRLVAVPLSVTMSTFEKQKTSLVLTLLQLALMVAVFVVSNVFSFEMKEFLVLYTALMTAYYMLMLAVCFNIAVKGRKDGRKSDN
ncbi:oligosaccharide flippase family protein [bacterium]|nr:oligosaccharide flippase family protein [bacterium]